MARERGLICNGDQYWPLGRVNPQGTASNCVYRLSSSSQPSNLAPLILSHSDFVSAR